MKSIAVYTSKVSDNHLHFSVSILSGSLNLGYNYIGEWRLIICVTNGWTLWRTKEKQSIYWKAGMQAMTCKLDGRRVAWDAPGYFGWVVWNHIEFLRILSFISNSSRRDIIIFSFFGTFQWKKSLLHSLISYPSLLLSLSLWCCSFNY